MPATWLLTVFSGLDGLESSPIQLSCLPFISCAIASSPSRSLLRYCAIALLFVFVGLYLRPNIAKPDISGAFGFSCVNLLTFRSDLSRPTVVDKIGNRVATSSVRENTNTQLISLSLVRQRAPSGHYHTGTVSNTQSEA